jgi:hypothetical protein
MQFGVMNSVFSAPTSRSARDARPTESQRETYFLLLERNISTSTATELLSAMSLCGVRVTCCNRRGSTAAALWSSEQCSL